MDTTPSSQNPDALKVIIFRAAEAIVSELGASQLTFASLSERSKIDEATLQQMFPDREALLSAMIEYRLERFRVRWGAYESVLPDEPMRELKALLLSNMSESSEEKNLDSAIFAAAASNPALLQTSSDNVQGLFDILEKSPLGLAQAAILFFSVRGYRLFEQLNMCPMTDAQRTEFQEQIMRLARMMYEARNGE
ncbi:MAG: TetR/AcrR family transcriptional regulator [Pseudomonadales bacterium]|uniref:HTH tetR-type domain-containing protein n=1 Tax=Halopseudomonas aestusnigri TaxID=857252 RepID=A0AAQ1G759_9GAMM|nr:TetR/AcrR family transcriptional regulator [Halopseudomonas aestusnigri]MAG99914.1 TetR/AcrR family transcriptional regulator [Pseudomonadales bacterium]MEE2798453.1 TetR/AcrR family transcriptional regulator [Pseudomonadota bacterium]HBT58571.1 TetR/AcrR family transcriptional regulator [Pseudomonas sp.]MAK73177.1 TetR/AcrR family transcriptional regulator [Pseudomonadales bacterium]MAP78011.1 TetR/AcrR family transcriptional regulator [Pseudomonadales bacterium]